MDYNFLSKLTLFYNPEQTLKEAKKEFLNDLKKAEDERDEITNVTYNSLNHIDKIIVTEFSKNYRRVNNAIRLSVNGIGYTERAIFKRLEKISNVLYDNIQKLSEN